MPGREAPSTPEAACRRCSQLLQRSPRQAAADVPRESRQGRATGETGPGGHRALPPQGPCAATWQGGQERCPLTPGLGRVPPPTHTARLVPLQLYPPNTPAPGQRHS